MLSYVNNKFCSLEKAQISVNDRGYQFGDAVYEVILYKDGKFLDFEGHLKRLRKSMSRIDFTLNISNSAIKTIIKRLVVENLNELLGLLEDDFRDMAKDKIKSLINDINNTDKLDAGKL